MTRLTTLLPSGLPGRAYHITPRIPTVVTLPDNVLSEEFCVVVRETEFNVITRDNEFDVVTRDTEFDVMTREIEFDVVTKSVDFPVTVRGTPN